jgi:hypothetical protein
VKKRLVFFRVGVVSVADGNGGKGNAWKWEEKVKEW